MQISITHSGVVNSVEVSASVQGVLNVIPSLPINVELQLFRDGQNGKSAYQIAVENGYTGTEQDFASDLIEQDVDFNAYYIFSKS
jgi:hypothetical protein